MTLKERLVEQIQQEGFDFVSACEWAERHLAEVRSLPAGTRYAFHGPSESIYIRRNAS